jgi:lipid II:glycine glycyltransferase (peptidoglycan interpeptide bridge formation enzyme)
VHAGGASLGVGFGVKARGRKQFRELPASVPLQEALEELDQRTRELMEGVNDVRDALEDEVEKRQATEAQLRTDLDSAVQRLDEQDRRVAVGGIRLEALGVFLVALGLVLALVGSVVP